MPPERRRFLAGGLASVAGLAGVAGCLGGGPDEGDAGDADDGGEADASTPTPVEDSEYDLTVDHDVESWTAYDPDWEPPTDPPALDADVETVIEGLEVPWDLAFAPDGDLFVSERIGRISRYDGEAVTSVAAPDVIDRADSVAPGDDAMEWWGGGSEGGLMGLAVHPNYPDVPLVYAVYTYKAGADDYRNRVVYYDADADDPGATETVVVDSIPGHEVVHNGSRLAFGPANYLWVTTGDANDTALSPDPSSVAGKVLRVEPDGSAPADNPDLGGDPRVYSVGHRNPQGISFLPDGTPIVTEHGPGYRDEVQIVRPGDDHGWGPEEDRARDGDTYPGTDFARPVAHSGTDTTWAPSGCVFRTGGAADGWRNRLLVGGLRSQRLLAVTVHSRDGDPADATGGERHDADWTDAEYDAVSHGLLADELGRVRHVEQGPDGSVYAITSNRDGRSNDGDGFPREDDDRLVRLTPEDGTR
ncbi:PQQ-dependent sugar dehydrogenase [Halorubrum sp. JWXQ-INN 858]|uniref:PQQ-dependent sugar dehydrogenase n=1 Tax=Halorubrum sp. JWXQ-INN 858 TaxID=2690782 RepID=UPI00135791D3|nr:PQQ-dependent sugar dehydrogenase [Halorubrum sp. JWXQ-INN 858]MWV65867.1 PQQ-dependent sugar dehydrogenase [Halorubrum sp. JWXQ-INN 858]